MVPAEELAVVSWADIVGEMEGNVIELMRELCGAMSTKVRERRNRGSKIRISYFAFAEHSYITIFHFSFLGCVMCVSA